MSYVNKEKRREKKKRNRNVGASIWIYSSFLRLLVKFLTLKIHVENINTCKVYMIV